VSSSRDFGVEQFFRADEFRADDPSPNKSYHCGMGEIGSWVNANITEVGNIDLNQNFTNFA
jgi:hypothetical protein